MWNSHSHHASENAIVNVPIGGASAQAFAPQPGLHYSVGIHPWDTEKVTAAHWTLLEAVAQHPQVVAIGETGLDALRGAPLAVQLDVFRRHALLAERLGKPLIIHMVRTMQQVLLLKREINPAQPWVIHGFRGGAQMAQTLLRAGCYLSFGCHFNADAVRATPLNRLLLETDDATSNSPNASGLQEAQPLPIEVVAKAVAQAKGVSVAALEICSIFGQKQK